MAPKINSLEFMAKTCTEPRKKQFQKLLHRKITRFANKPVINDREESFTRSQYRLILFEICFSVPFTG